MLGRAHRARPAGGARGGGGGPDAEAPGIDEIVAKQLREEEAQSFLRLARDAMHSDGGSVLPSLEHLRQAAGTNSGGPAQAKALFLLAVMELNRATGGARAFAPGTSAHGSSRNTIGIAPSSMQAHLPPSLRIRAPAAMTQEEEADFEERVSGAWWEVVYSQRSISRV